MNDLGRTHALIPSADQQKLHRAQILRTMTKSHVPGGRGGTGPRGRVSQASEPHPQGPQKQSCYMRVFEKGFSGPMNQLKSLSHTRERGLLPLLHLRVGTSVHTHTARGSTPFLLGIPQYFVTKHTLLFPKLLKADAYCLNSCSELI